MKKIIKTSQAPAAVGPYSQAVKHGNMLFCSGQIPLDAKTGEIIGNNITEQAHQVFKNLLAVLEAGGCSLKDVVKTTCLLANMDDFVAFNEVYAQYFSEDGQFPARSTFAVKTLPKNALVEVEAIAIES